MVLVHVLRGAVLNYLAVQSLWAVPVTLVLWSGFKLIIIIIYHDYPSTKEG